MADEPSLAQSLAVLANIDGHSLAYLTREANLYLDVLRVQGERQVLTQGDLHVLFARMLDIAQIEPLPQDQPQQAYPNLQAIEAEVKPPRFPESVFRLRPPKE